LAKEAGMRIMNERCLDEKALSSYMDERLSEAGRKKIELHIADCNACLDMLLVAHEAQRKRFSTRPPRHQRWRARLARTILAATIFFESDAGAKLAKARFATPKKKRLGLKWLFSAIFFFALSFAFRHYFLQFLAISIVLGFKWVMEGEGAKRVIMIFKGIQEKEKKVERKSPPDVSYIVGEGFKPSPTKRGGDRYGKPE